MNRTNNQDVIRTFEEIIDRINLNKDASGIFDSKVVPNKYNAFLQALCHEKHVTKLTRGRYHIGVTSLTPTQLKSLLEALREYRRKSYEVSRLRKKEEATLKSKSAPVLNFVDGLKPVDSLKSLNFGDYVFIEGVKHFVLDSGDFGINVVPVKVLKNREGIFVR